jgi:hypothetical protein
MTKEYAAALEAAQSASAKFRTIQAAYRSRQIGDAEYIAGRKAFEASQVAFDVARGEVA